MWILKINLLVWFSNVDFEKAGPTYGFLSGQLIFIVASSGVRNSRFGEFSPCSAFLVCLHQVSRRVSADKLLPERATGGHGLDDGCNMAPQGDLHVPWLWVT